MKFSIKDFFSKCYQIRWKLRIWSHLLKKSLIENFIFCAADVILSSFTLLTYWIHFLMLNYSAQAPHGLNMSYKARQDRSLEKEKDSSNPPLIIVVEKVIFVSTAWKGSKYWFFSSPYFPVFDQKNSVFGQFSQSAGWFYEFSIWIFLRSKIRITD